MCKSSISLSVLIYSKPPVELQMHPLNHFPIQVRIYINPWASITAIQHPSLSQQHFHAALLMWCSHQAESDFLVHVCHETSSFVPLTVFPSSHLKWKLSLSSSSRHEKSPPVLQHDERCNTTAISMTYHWGNTSAVCVLPHISQIFRSSCHNLETFMRKQLKKPD